MHSTLKIDTEAFLQFVFDNADHNVATLDGLNTWHVMGGIFCITPRDYVQSETDKIPKLSKMPSAAEMAAKHAIKIIPYESFGKSGLESVIYSDISALGIGESVRFPEAYEAYIWSKQLSIKNVPMWRGFMENLTIDSPSTISRVICLPFINNPPSNLSTINTALHMAVEKCRKYGQKTCFVTFDQQLYIKARDIVNASNNKDFENVFIRLGGFHTLMSYMGAIGNIMSDIDFDIFRSRLNDLLNDKNAEEPFNYYACSKNEHVQLLSHKFVDKLESLTEKGPTAQLWLQYFDSITVMLQFIQAERCGDWKLHLQSIKKMLPIFHAGGHFPYAKSAQIYLQDMARLELVMDDVEYRNFTEEGYFTICRSDKHFSGVPPDQTIEQTLMRDCKLGTGGLTHGRGITPSTQARFTLGKMGTFEVIESLEEYCNVYFGSSEQHVDLRDSRQEKDNEDTSKFFNWFKQHNPFTAGHALLSLSTGIVGDATIDPHQAYQKGQKSMAGMIGKNAKTISRTASSKIRSLSLAKSGVKLTDHHCTSVDCTLLFQRISVLLHNEVDAQATWDYELSPFPLSMFDETGLMRKSQKSELYNIFQTSLNPQQFLPDAHFVIDGGFLLHRVIWTHGQTYDEVCDLYVNYVKKHYGNSAWVVFDGYDETTLGTKSYERYRRGAKKITPSISFDGSTPTALSQAVFLLNNGNKSRFVELLSHHLRKSGIRVQQAPEDADRLIVTTAIEERLSTNSTVIVVGNDVDLLMLIIALTPIGEVVMFLKVVAKNNNKLYSSADYKAMQNYVLFGHAFFGCDTTSSLYGKGKKSVFTLLQNTPNLQAVASIFNNSNSSKESIFTAAKETIITLYTDKEGRKHLSTSMKLGELRYKHFKDSALHGKTQVRLARLPPTESVTYYHALRVFYQVQTWLGNQLVSLEWGWKQTMTMLIPIMSTDPVAPENLLQIIFCACAKGCSKNCKCKASGLKCSDICKNCNGISCSNAKVPSPITVVNTDDLDQDSREADKDNIDDSDDEEFNTMWEKSVYSLHDEENIDYMGFE